MTLLIQSVAIVVQSTATALIYIDCRMRREGLDLDLLAYVERRDAGATALAGPLPRARRPRDRPASHPAGYAPAGYAAAGIPAGRIPTGTPSRDTASPAYPQPIPRAVPAARRLRPSRTYPPPAGYRQAPAARRPLLRRPPPEPAADDPPPQPTRWAAPGAAARRRDPESPWALIGAVGACLLAPPTRARRSPRTATRRASWAERELSDPVYQAAEPTPIDRIARAIGDFFERLFGAAARRRLGLDLRPHRRRSSSSIVIVAAFLVWGVPACDAPRAGASRPRCSARTRRASAAELRRAAASHAAAAANGMPRSSSASARSRAARSSGARSTPRPARRCTRSRAPPRARSPRRPPSSRRPPTAFDDVRYLRRPGTEELYRLVAEVDDRIAAARPVVTEPAEAPA